MDPFVAEIRIFPFNFPPKGWAWCDGQILPISQNTALFSLLGTTYGGDGKSTFGLPDLQGRTPMHIGGNQPGPGLSLRDLGETGGEETVTLLQSEFPSHTHLIQGSTSDANSNSPATQLLASAVAVGMYAPPSSPPVQLNPQVLTTAGGDLPHNNLMPYLTFYFNIALQGVFPPRT